MTGKTDLRNLLFDNFIKFYLIGSAVLYWPGMMAYAPQEMFIQYSAICFFGFSLFVPKRRETSNVYLALILFYALFHTLILHFEDRPRVQALNIFFGILTIKVIAERIDLNVSKIGKLFAVFAVLNMGMMVLQHFDVDPIFMSVNYDKMTRVDLVGFLGARFAIGCLAALMMPFVFYVSPWLCLILLPLLFIGKSSTAVAAALLSFMFLMWFKKVRTFKFKFKKFSYKTSPRILFWILAVIILSAGIYYVVFVDAPSGQFHKRFKVWWMGLHLLRVHPWVGHGLGMWHVAGINSIQENGIPEHWSWAHNEYLQYFFELGVFGMITLYAYFKNFIRRLALKTKEQCVMFAAFLCMAAISFFHFPFHIGRLTSVCLIIFSLMEAHTSKQRVSYE